MKKYPMLLATCILQLLMYNSKSAQCLLNTLLYYLERDAEIARMNIVYVIGKVVIDEGDETTYEMKHNHIALKLYTMVFKMESKMVGCM